MRIIENILAFILLIAAIILTVVLVGKVREAQERQNKELHLFIAL
jgi:hypothetical protein